MTSRPRPHGRAATAPRPVAPLLRARRRWSGSTSFRRRRHVFSASSATSGPSTSSESSQPLLASADKVSALDPVEDGGPAAALVLASALAIRLAAAPVSVSVLAVRSALCRDQEAVP